MAQQQKSGSTRKVRDVMTANPAAVTQKDSVRDAARIMKEQDTGVVPVCDDRRIVGLITDRDIVVRLIAEGRDAVNATVSEVMSKSIRTVREDATVDEVLGLMSSAEVRRVPVVNDNQELVGIVSLGDVSVGTNKDGKVGQTVEEISSAPPNN